MSLDDVIDLVILVAKAFLIINLVMVVFAMMTWVERKLIARFQYRYGPNRVGPFGLLQPIADLIKLIRKEAFAPRGVSSVLYLMAPVASLFFALAAFAVIPFGDVLSIGDREIPLHMAADLNIAVLFVLAMSGLGFYGLIVAGHASNSKFGLLGSLRACAQLISYEVSLGLAVLPVLMMAESLSLVDIVYATSNWQIGDFSPWFAVWAPISFLLFVIAALAESNRAPFDLPEAEQELVAGYHTEFGGLRYALFANAEYINMITVSALGVVFFLGGWRGPGVESIGPLMGVFWMAAKIALFLFVFIWIRATVPRLRYDRLMRFGWKVMLPLATLQFVASAAIVSQQWGYVGQ